MPRNGWPSDEDSKPGSNACRTVPCSGSRAPPGCTPAGRRSLHACGPSARTHCALSTQSGPSFALSRELAVFRGVFPRHPSRLPRALRSHRRKRGARLGTAATRWHLAWGGVPVAARDTPCAFMPRVPRGQSPAVLALLFFVRGRPGHREVLSSTPGLPPPDARSSHLSPVVTSKDASRPCQMGTGGSVTPGRAPRVQTEVCSGHSHVPRSPCRSQMLCGLGLLPSSLLHDFELYQLPPLQGQGAERH